MVEAEGLPKALVILGAGAAKDVWGGTGTRNTTWEPPLASELFTGPSSPSDGIEAHRTQAYSAILNQYAGAKVLGLDLGARASGEAFEDELQRFADHQQSRTRRQFLEIPAYLRHLMLEVSRHYTDFRGTYVRLLRSLLQDVPHEAVFVVLNYDTLLEDTLAEVEPNYAISEMGDYVALGRSVRIVKLHGSVDWGIPIGRAQGGNAAKGSWNELLDRIDRETLRGKVDADPREGGPQLVRVVGSEACWEWQSVIPQVDDPQTQHLYPLLTAPLAKKGGADVVCPPAHREALVEFFPACEKVLIAGTSGRDADLLALLRGHLGEIRSLYVVNENRPAAEKAYNNFEEAVPILVGSEVSFYGAGLKEFAAAMEFSAFLSA